MYSKRNSPGPDEASNMMLKAVPKIALSYILKIFNLVWDECYFHDKWRIATIIPIPKPGKDRSNPSNYPPISRTSCLCKTLEKMINGRPVEYMEHNKIFSEIQCGFRRYKSTIDHLVRMDTFVRRAFSKDENIISIFDMEKAYDKTWR